MLYKVQKKDALWNGTQSVEGGGVQQNSLERGKRMELQKAGESRDCRKGGESRDCRKDWHRYKQMADICEGPMLHTGTEGEGGE